MTRAAAGRTGRRTIGRRLADLGMTDVTSTTNSDITEAAFPGDPALARAMAALLALADDEADARDHGTRRNPQKGVGRIAEAEHWLRLARRHRQCGGRARRRLRPARNSRIKV